ncbi:hypothetical protein I5393_05740 [Citrobacter freundii]|uniref:hypothetical protein n=1 Tax=Citrobacter freundii TaxID=546 RepID=UPI0018FFF7FD|nr:hypothetical protein [Citrobacter freundii]MBJ8767886.1 hypothetical protein [Citrobacter freundii]
MSRLTAVICTSVILLIAALSWSALHYSQKAADAESDNRVLKSDNTLQSQVIATQAFNINRFNQTAQTVARANAITASASETTVIKYREILRREKTCDLPVPADIAGGLLKYANRLRTRAMHTITTVADPADGGTTAASGMTYCQAVLWINPLLATIEQGNNNFAGIRELEQVRVQQTRETP